MKKSIFYGFLFCCSLLAMSCNDDPTCDDGEMNGEETGIDCGGPDCPVCPTCSDGIQNGDETGIDCGGTTCDICATCDDGIQNGTETDVDCGGECAPCVTTVEDDKANIQKTFDDLLRCVTDFRNSRAVDIFLEDFLGLADGETLNEDWIEDITQALEFVVDFDHISDNSRMDFSYHAGTRIYNHEDDSWTRLSDVDDKIIFRFPSEPSQPDNNVELIMDRYLDQQVTIDGETIFLPTSMHIMMSVNNERIMELDLKNVVYANNADFEIPVEISATLFLDPIDMTLEVQRQSTTEYRVETTIVDGSSCKIELEMDVDLKDDDFENLDKNGFEKVDVQVKVGRMTFQSFADLATLITFIDDPITDTELNSLLDLNAFFDDVKIADIEISQSQETVIIFYKDGSSEDSETYYESFWEDVKDLWENLFG